LLEFLKSHLATCIKFGKKKVKSIPEIKETLKENKLGPEYQLVFDELWTFIRKKSNKIRIWTIKCIETKQIVAYHSRCSFLPASFFY
jgi:hypothetical protein